MTFQRWHERWILQVSTIGFGIKNCANQRKPLDNENDSH
jgi:hypothetical protein